MRTKILTACVDPERGKYVAWVDGSPGVFAMSNYGHEAAIGELILTGRVSCVFAMADVFTEATGAQHDPS